jgi:hypothetical protein
LANNEITLKFKGINIFLDQSLLNSIRPILLSYPDIEPFKCVDINLPHIFVGNNRGFYFDMRYYEFHGLETGLILNSETLVVATKEIITIFRIAEEKNPLIMVDTLEADSSLPTIKEL